MKIKSKLIPRLADRGANLLIRLNRKVEPLYRDQFDRLIAPHIEKAAQGLIRLRLKDEGLAIAEEKIQPDEADITRDIAETMKRFLQREYQATGQIAERAGNTKTYGLVRAEFKINNDLPESLQVGLFKAGKSYPAYVRFGGPGPRVVPDTEDNGILSIGIKLMGVPGEKLLDDEQYTVDFSGISSPSFTTPNIQENVKLQKQIGLGSPAWYFLNPLDSHYLDMLMQGLYAKLHATPLELTYHSCVPYLFGQANGQPRAIKFALIPRVDTPSSLGALSDNYLRQRMIDTLTRQAVTFDFAIQFQTDPVTMPIENASVVWCKEKSPFIKIATLELPVQKFDYPAQDAFARNLTINPWHTLAELRPLGNQNRARKTIYMENSRMRQHINHEAHIEPTGKEDFVTEHRIKAAPATKSRQPEARLVDSTD